MPTKQCSLSHPLKGNPLLSGAVKVAEGYNFTVRVPEGAEATLLLYKKKGKNPVKEICLTDEYRDGEICSILLPDFQAEKYEYNYIFQVLLFA